MADHLNTIRDAVIGGKHGEIKGLVQQALDAGLDPGAIINDALIAAMDVVGKDFGAGKIFVPEMLVSAVTMKAGLDVVKPRLAGGERQSRGTIVMATVKGDLHDIGKNLVSMMLEGAGFKVMDLGVDLSVEKLIDQVKSIQPDILGLSALLTTTMPEMQKVIGELKTQGLRGTVKVLVGGAPVDRAFAEKIGADGYGANAAEAVELARRFAAAKA
ncbi:MAG: corrinoid protein [Desulfobacterales bacterium]|jgi:corrinoid protein of di/trimethylamine methyltransferase|nr:corrinoid protein [Desulfobacterales bacterium]